MKRGDEHRRKELHRADPGQHEKEVDEVERAELLILDPLAQVTQSLKGVEPRMASFFMGFLEEEDHAAEVDKGEEGGEPEGKAGTEMAAQAGIGEDPSKGDG